MNCKWRNLLTNIDFNYTSLTGIAMYLYFCSNSSKSERNLGLTVVIDLEGSMAIVITKLFKTFVNSIKILLYFVVVFYDFFKNTFSCLLRLYFFNCLSRKLIYINSIDQCVIFVMHMYYELLMVHVWQETFLSDFSNGKTLCSYHSYQANVVP